MKLQLDPTIVYRVPRFSYQSSLAACWDELKAAIAASSKDFYPLIAEVEAKDIDRLPERVKLTIWKYFNRARYRCVPYGSFASVGIFDSRKSMETPLVISDKPVVHAYTDWSAIETFEPDIDLDEVLLFSNSSWYLLTDGMRYIGKGKEGYELLDNVQDALVLEILRHCESPVALAVLRELLAEPVPINELKELLQQMIEMQMLYTSVHSNIIGDDYWKKSGYRAKADEQRYEISINTQLGGTLPTRIFRHVPELAERLERIVASNQSNSLQSFMEGFQRRFEGKEVPLMVALDPEMGLGYAELEVGGIEDELVAALARKRIPAEKTDSPVEAFFRKQLGGRQGKVINLEELQLEEQEQERLPLANTTSLLCSIADEQLVIDLFGGTTGNALHGRFSLASEQIRDHGRKMAQLESDANPDVIFFDIAYQAGNRIDNVNRRAQLYPYSLSILNYDTSADPLNLSDILVSVSGGQVLLRSRKHNKRLIPRLASAYNYTKSDLSLFRFLCDVQHQELQSYLQLSLSEIFKGLNYYPRVQYKNIIVCPAKWKLSTASLLKGKQKDTSHCLEQLQAAGVERYFKNGFSDQTLLYDLEKDEDLHAFLCTIEKQKETEIEEAFIGQRADVIDEHGNAYCAQFVLNYTHCEAVYQGFAEATTNTAVSPSIKAPGSEWLYFEIYCHAQRADQILQHYIRAFLNDYVHKINQWFFIRYTENGPHLRLRFKLNRMENLQTLLPAFSNVFKAELESGIISELAVKTYKREVHRYGANLMDAVEAHFCIDSACVLSLLESQPEQESLYQHCLEMIFQVAESQVFEANVFEELLMRVSASFNREHELKAPDFRRINEAYKSFAKRKPSVWSQQQQFHIQQLSSNLIRILQACEQERRGALFADLIHMHVNRLFPQQQRTHEMLMYYFCHKQFLSRRWKAAGAGVAIP